MNLLGCLIFVFLILCVMAFVASAAVWMIVGTIILLFKLLGLMVWIGGVVLVIAAVAWLVARL